ncbi:MAG: hypothetical protein ACYC2H_11930 [Thermoplasmatota archaeon]
MGRRLALFWVVLLASVLPTAAAEIDEDGPILTSIALSATTLHAGETLVVSVGASDATGIAQPFVEIRGPEDRLRLHSDTRCDAGEGRTNAVLACPFPLASTLPAGTYDVWAIQINDVLWNSAHYQSPQDFQADAQHQLTFTVESDNHDLEGPTLHQLEVLTPTVPAGGNVTFRATASDATGLRTVGFGLLHAAGSPWTSGACPVSGTSGAVLCSVVIPGTHPAGRYNVATVTLVDINGVASESAQGPWGSSLPDGPGNQTWFEVVSASQDNVAPRLLRFEAPLLPVSRGEAYEVRIWADDAGDGVAFAFTVFQNEVGRAYWRKHLDVQPTDCTPWVSRNQPIVCTDTVPLDFPLGEQRLGVLFLKDPATNEQQYTRVGSGNGATPILEDGLNRTSFWVGPRLLDDPGRPNVLAIEPQSIDVAAGTVLPVVGRLAGSADEVLNLTFSFVSEAGHRLGAAGCEPTARIDGLGFACGVILPPETPAGDYALDELHLVRRDGTRVDLAMPEAAPSFAVTASADADLGAPLPPDWPDHIEGTITLASFNSGPSLKSLRVDSTQAADQQSSGETGTLDSKGEASWTGTGDEGSLPPGDGGQVLEPRRGTPGYAALLAVLALAGSAAVDRARQRR